MLLGYRQSLRPLPKPLFLIAHAIFDDRQGLHDPQGRNTTPPRSGTTQSSAVRCQAFLCRVLQNSDLMAKRNAFQLQSCAAFPLDESTNSIIETHSTVERNSLWNACEPHHLNQFDIYENHRLSTGSLRHCRRGNEIARKRRHLRPAISPVHGRDLKKWSAACSVVGMKEHQIRSDLL